MAFHLLPNTAITFLASILCMIALGRVWTRRNNLGGRPFVWLMISIIVWSFAAAIESGIVGQAEKIFWSKMEYIGLVQIPPLLLIFSLDFNHRNSILPYRARWLLWVIPLTTLALVWTNEYHGLVWPYFKAGSLEYNVLLYGHGPGFYIFQAYLYSLAILAAVIFAQAVVFSGKGLRKQSLAILGTIFVPAFGGFAYIFNLSPIPGVDWSPVGASISALLLTYSIYKLGLLEFIPIARGMIFELMQDGVLIIDQQGRLLDVNPSAQALLGKSVPVLGASVEKIPSFETIFQGQEQKIDWGDAAATLAVFPPSEIRIDQPGGSPRYLTVGITPLGSTESSVEGYAITLKEVTRLHQAEEQKRIQREHIEMLLDLAPFRVAYLDREGRFLMANKRYTGLFGLNKDQFIGCESSDLLPPAFYELVRPDLDVVMGGNPLQHEIEWQGLDGNPVYEKICYTPFFGDDGQVVSLGMYSLDFTEEHQKEKELLGNQTLLEMKLSRRTNRLRLALTHIEEEIEKRKKVTEELHQMEQTLVEKVTSQSRKLAGLYEVIIAGGQTEESGQLLGNVLTRILETVEASAVCIHETSDSGMRLVEQRGLSPDLLAGIGLVEQGWVDAEYSPLLVNDLTNSTELPAPFRASGYQVYIGCIVHRVDKGNAILSLFWQSQPVFSIEDISLISTIAEEVGVILENINLRQRIETAVAVKERRRLARDLHDSVTQSLHSLVLAAYSATNRLDQGDYDKLRKSLRQLSDGAQQALKEMRLLLYEMRLVPLQEVDMLDAIKTRLEMVEGRAGVEFTLDVQPGATWPKAWEGDLFCIAVESLNNSLKHAQADHIHFTIAGNPKDFRLEIRDNGIGFDPHKNTHGGMGLTNMAERAERLGGLVKIESQPGAGTVIIFEANGASKGVKQIE